MRGLPGPRIEPVSPELAGGFFTTEPCDGVFNDDNGVLLEG